MDGKTFSLLRIIGKILKWYLLIVIPLSLAFDIYIYLNVSDLSSITSSNASKILLTGAKEILGQYPFADQIAKIFSKSFKFNELKFNSIVNDIIKSLICYTLIDWIKYVFRVRKDTAKVETNFSRWAKLGIIYTTWFFLTAYVTNIVLNRLFDLIDTLTAVDLTVVKTMLLAVFFLLAVLVFKYRTKEKILLCMLWTLSEKIVYPILTTFLLSFMGNWCYRAKNIDEMILPIVLYLAIAAGIDYLKDRTRYGIVSWLKPAKAKPI